MSTIMAETGESPAGRSIFLDVSASFEMFNTNHHIQIEGELCLFVF